MNLKALIANFRSDIADTVEPYLVSQSDAIRFANIAQVEACRRAKLLRDSTSDICEIDVDAGEPVVGIDPRIIKVVRARLVGSSHPLAMRDLRSMDDLAPGWEEAQTGTPQIFIPNWESSAVRLFPAPIKNYRLALTVIREPLRPLVGDSDEPEIPPRTHEGLIHGMKQLAYSRPDTDLFNADLATKAEAAFTAEFGPKVSAREEHWSQDQYYDMGES